MRNGIFEVQWNLVDFNSGNGIVPRIKTGFKVERKVMHSRCWLHFGTQFPASICRPLLIAVSCWFRSQTLRSNMFMAYTKDQSRALTIIFNSTLRQNEKSYIHWRITTYLYEIEFDSCDVKLFCSVNALNNLQEQTWHSQGFRIMATKLLFFFISFRSSQW